MAAPNLTVNDRISIPGRELEFRFARSPGPGGQNVNKVNSKAILKWNVLRSTAITEAVRQRIVAQQQSRISESGELVIRSHEHRDQTRNIEACRERLRAIIRQGVAVPRKRKVTRPTAGSVRRRMAEKKRISERKQSRQAGRLPGDG